MTVSGADSLDAGGGSGHRPSGPGRTSAGGMSSPPAGASPRPRPHPGRPSRDGARPAHGQDRRTDLSELVVRIPARSPVRSGPRNSPGAPGVDAAQTHACASTLERPVMKIGIIGAGNIGGNLTRRLTALGHDVSVANSRGPETLAALAEETGATAVRVEEAARGAEVVVVTIPVKASRTCRRACSTARPDDVVVIDTGNYYPQQRDGRIAAIEDGASRRAAGRRSSSATPWSRRSTTSTPSTCWNAARPAGDPGPHRAPGRRRRRGGEATVVRPDRRARLRHRRRGRPRRLLAPAARHPGLRAARGCRRGHQGPRGGAAGAPGGLSRVRAATAVNHTATRSSSRVTA